MKEKILVLSDEAGMALSSMRLLAKNGFDISLDSREKLYWTGLAHIDMRKDDNGNIKLFELNPRLWVSHLFAEKAADFNAPLLSYYSAIRKKIKLRLPDVTNSYISIKSLTRPKNLTSMFFNFPKKHIKFIPSLIFQDLNDLKPILYRLIKR